MNEKIQSSHLQRRAVVYARQSTLKQLVEHRESTARQYALKQRALELGWHETAVDLVDEDLGQSGASAAWRAGFQRIAESVAHGRIGAIFALEVSRLSRSSADWHKLLELCGLADVVIADEQSVYNPLPVRRPYAVRDRSHPPGAAGIAPALPTAKPFA
jgi:DNA invertase Pin-like site-specific DNA recombinase